MKVSLSPSFEEEEQLHVQGYRHIAGLDEVGRGALAGPVMAAAVILPRSIKAPWLKQVKDSKQLSPAVREVLFAHICEAALSVGIGIASHHIIDQRGIATATRLAMQQALEQLTPPPDFLLIDYIKLPQVPIPQKGITDGDARCLSMACASIVAKVTRDHIMTTLDGIVPGYNLTRHKGYGTREHLSYLEQRGPSCIHRLSFRPVKELTAPRLLKEF